MQELIHLINEMSPYLLLGFLMAGVMHAFIPRVVYSRYLSGRGFRSVLNAALLGIPLPLCSCGVIPTAMSLRREGASKGATVSFLIATPQTGVDSIFATFSLLGLPFAIIRPLAALCTALFGGFLADRCEGECSVQEAPSHRHTAGGGDAVLPEGFAQKLKEALRYAFVEMMQDIGKWLMVGLLVAALITLFVPDGFFALFAGNTLLSILFVLLFSMPMYLCATGSIPIAVALMLKGLTPGAALVLLMAGPACNAASILVIRKVLGRRTLMLYLLAIVGGAVCFALGMDYLLPRHWFAVTGMASSVTPDCCLEMETDYFGTACSILMGLLLIHAWIRSQCSDDACTCGGDGCSCEADGCISRCYRVTGMNCNHCRTNVERAIRSVTGVTEVTVSLADEEARVEGDYDEEALLQAVRQLGFDITPQ